MLCRECTTDAVTATYKAAQSLSDDSPQKVAHECNWEEVTALVVTVPVQTEAPLLRTSMQQHDYCIN